MIKKGQKVEIKKEWQDKGDDQFNWVAAEDQYSEDGNDTLLITTTNSGMAIPPVHRVKQNMLEGF